MTFPLFHLHEALSLQELRAGRGQPRGPLWTILFNVEKHNTEHVKSQFFENAIESTLHTGYFLLTHSESNLKSLPGLEGHCGLVPSYSGCIHSALPGLFHSSPAAVLTGPDAPQRLPQDLCTAAPPARNTFPHRYPCGLLPPFTQVFIPISPYQSYFTIASKIYSSGPYLL